MAFVRIPAKKISFLGTGEEFSREVKGKPVKSFKAFRMVTSPTLFYVSPFIKNQLSLRWNVHIRTNREAVKYLTDRIDMFKLFLPKRTVIRLYNRNMRAWNVQRRSLRVYVTFYIIYAIAFEDYLTGRSEFPIVQEVYHTFGFRGTVNEVRSDKSLMFFYKIMERFTEKIYPDRIPVGLTIGMIDVGWKTPYSEFPRREMSRLRELGFFDHSYTKALREIKEEVDLMM